MGIQLKSTSGIASTSVKILCYGQSGSGKTTLIKTLPSPVVLSAEGGLLSLSGVDVPFIEISSMEELKEAYIWCRDSEESQVFETICLDSVSEVAEVVLSAEKAKSKDPRQAYGALQDEMNKIVRAFRDLPKHIYMSAKVEKVQDDMGRILYGPSMPGTKLGQSLPYFFDEVLALRAEKDDTGHTQRALLCDNDGIWNAKDRSGKLEQWEAADLGEIINKIKGGV